MSIRVAFLAPYYPLPISSGGHTRIANLVGQLAGRYQIHWLSLTDSETGSAPPGLSGLAAPPILIPARANRRWQDKLTEAIRPSRLKRTSLRLAGLVEGLPIDAVRMKDPRLTKAIKNLLRTQQIDVIQIEYGAMAVYLPLIRQLSPDTRIIIDELEVISVAIARRRAFEPNPPSWFARRDAHSWARFEQQIWRAADAVLTMSAAEKEVVDDVVGPGKGRVVPNGVDVDSFRPPTQPVEQSGPPRLLFVGNLNHRPNEEGLATFLKTAWPKLAARFPDLELHIVGPPASEPLALADAERVKSHGFVDDVRPHLAAAVATIAPIVTGGGTRLKVLESLAAGTPVISTHLGAEGLDLRNNHEALLIDSIDEFPDAVGALLDQPGLRAALRAAGRRHVERRFSWASIAANLEHVWLEQRDQA